MDEPDENARPVAAVDGGLAVASLAGRSLFGQVVALAGWPLLEQALAFMVGFVDLMLAGRMGSGAERVAILDAMAVTGYVAWFFNILQGAVATGVMALVARATGGRDSHLANRALGQGLWLGLAAGVASLAVLQAGIPLLLRAIGLGPEAAVQAEKFLRILAFSGPFSGAMFAVNAALRGSGDTRTPFLSMVVVNGVNMALAWLLVFGPVPVGGRGVEGLACGAVGGWVAGLATAVFLLGKRRGIGLHWGREWLRPHAATMRRIVRVGIPQTVEIATMWAIHAFGLRMIASLRDAGSLGAHMIAIRVESMSFLPGFAIGTAAATLAGQYLGAGLPDMARRATRLSWGLAVGLMSTIGTCCVLGRRELIGWMAPGSELHLRLAGPPLVVSGLALPFFATCIVLKSAMRGVGATATVMRWSFASMIFYRVGVVWLLVRSGRTDLTAVWMAMAGDIVTQALVFTWLYRRGGWLRARV